MNRYARQMILPEVGDAGQARLGAAHVAVVGAGGLGCPVLQYLAGAGVGQITVIDPDHVEEHNLHRQPLYRMSDIGRPKAMAARDALLATNPSIRIEAQVAPLTPITAPDLAETADLVIDAADSYAVSYILSDACLAAHTPLVSASALRQSGYVGTFCGGAPSLRAVFPDLPSSGATCVTAGVLGPVVGVIGALQAQITLQILLDTTPSPLGKLVSLDLATLRVSDFSFLGSPEPDTHLPFLSRMQMTEQDIVVDLRSETEAPNLPTPNALRLAPDVAADHLNPTDRRIVLCCATGLRAWRTALDLQARGHRNLALLAAKADI